MRARHVAKIAVVGGGTAGWLTACVLAADHRVHGLEVMLVESPDVPIIGVGEGTWPSMRQTLQRIGLPEQALLRSCQATFKQGTRFCGWRRSDGADIYHHPFSLPVEYTRLNPARGWLAAGTRQCYADTVSAQVAVIEAGLGPKTAQMPEYAFAANYAYHFDAGAFAELLKTHGTSQLGIKYRVGNVVEVSVASAGAIESLALDDGENIVADLYVDCTGHRRVLQSALGERKFTDVSQILFNDRALAVQVPYPSKEVPIASATIATAHEAGWIWDIGLQDRRGVGCVYSSKFCSDDQARQYLAHYLADLDRYEVRSLQFAPGYERNPWRKNCIAVGLSAGFVEPLEASAIALVEQAAWAISEDLPASVEALDVVAKRFNQRMNYHWERIIEFLKLHYALSERSSAYWIAHVDSSTWPETLRENLILWNQRPPYHDDAPLLKELFPSASLQYVLYGMGFEPAHIDVVELGEIDAALQQVVEQRRQFEQGLPKHRQLIETLIVG